MKKVVKIILRILLLAITAIIVAAIAALGAMWIICNGPSPSVKQLFVKTVKETSAAGFLADMFLSDEEIEAIINVSEEVKQEGTNTSLIKIEPGKWQSVGYGDDGSEEQDLELVRVNGGTFLGYMLIVKDPSRVFVGIPDEFGLDKPGLLLAEMVEKYGAAAGINAGGFIDPNGKGTGGAPEGIVISGGELVWGGEDEVTTVIGFDSNYVLHVGKMTGQEALDAGICEAVSFGPALIINGKAQSDGGMVGGVNPRTAIGQREDGAVLMLVIDGRSVSSLGATFEDLVEVMLSYGAVNAGNLDGGSSTLMMLDGENVNNSAYIFGDRILATSFLVK